MSGFNQAMVPEVVQPFWAAMQREEFITGAAEEVGSYRKKGARWIKRAGGVRPRRGRNLKGRCLSFVNREEIALARARGETVRAIAEQLGRSPSTISRELRRNADARGVYRATTAHPLAWNRAARPKPAKLATNRALRRSLTWDQGPEMRDWKAVRIDAGIEIFFCDPHKPWQRGTNENTNGLLRQYFPKGTDLRVRSEAELDAVDDEFNDRPRKRLQFQKPIELIGPLLAA